MSTHQAEQDRGWSRRGFIAAVGAGALVACRPQSSDAGSEDSTARVAAADPGLTIRLYGAMILEPHARGVDVYMPLTNVGQKHRAFLGRFTEYGSRGGTPEIKDLAGEITLTGGRDNGKDFGNLPSFDRKILPSGAGMREYSAQVYHAKITLIGGSFSTQVDPTLYFDFTTYLPGRSRLTNIHLAKSVVWESYTDNVSVSGTGSGLTGPLTAGQLPALVIGHLPTTHKAEEIFHSRRIAVNDVDKHFAMLYQAFYPAGMKDEPDPWKNVDLPLPKLVGMVEKDGFTVTEDKDVGSPTCFGGCFGC